MKIILEGDNKVELEAVQYILEMYLLPWIESEEFKKIVKILEEAWTNRSEKSKEPSKKTPAKKASNSKSSSAQTKKGTKPATSAKKSSNTKKPNVKK
jgi:hypothetical protein